jgi:hypothetical protein
MDYDENTLTAMFIIVGFTLGACFGGILVHVQKEPDLEPMRRLIHSQRDSLRSLRTDFNAFRNNHERELMTIVRETLRPSPRSVASTDEPTAS